MRQSDPEMSYESFGDFVGGQTAQVLMNAGRLPMNAANEEDVHGRDQEE